MLTGNDDEEIQMLEKYMASEFEIKTQEILNVL
jgi:hypothetical protein